MTRRTQQYELYAAEAGAARGREFGSLDDLERWLGEAVLEPRWFAERFPLCRGIEVTRPRRYDGSVGTWHEDTGLGQIEMCPAHRCELFVLHEVAHVLARPYGSTSHDPTFVRVYLELVARVLGSTAYVDLRRRFLEAGIVIDDNADVAPSTWRVVA